MCYSATASLVSGVAITAVGVATLPLVRDRRERPFAALPLIFGVHQLLEARVWTQLEASGLEQIRTPAVAAWILIAWLVLPIYIPLSVRWFEPEARRRRVMAALAVVGAVTGIVLAVQSMSGPVSVAVHGHHLQYLLPLRPGWLLSAPYVAATCGALLVSSHRFVVAFGVALLIGLAVTMVVDATAFSSVWCFFAAVLSGGLYLHYAPALGPDWSRSSASPD